MNMEYEVLAAMSWNRLVRDISEKEASEGEVWRLTKAVVSEIVVDTYIPLFVSLASDG
jgi:uncharacterized membrane protein